MDIALFDYILPDELIAQVPARAREESRLMVLDRNKNTVSIGSFGSLADYLKEGDALVVNVTKVFKARLLGYRSTGGRVEIFLVRPIADGKNQPGYDEGECVWEALARPSRRLRVGEKVYFKQGNQEAVAHLDIVKRTPGGEWRVRFNSVEEQVSIIDQFGHVPLPVYIKRDDSFEDVERYQTIFADDTRIGAVAAPTAGFHFTNAAVATLENKGVRILKCCLHVGPGTFKPVKVNDIAKHTVDPELAELPDDTASAINETRLNGGRLFAVGTTTVRTLEAAPFEKGMLLPYKTDVSLYIRPGYQFRVVDHLVTNFHLPRSSLLILVSAFAGRGLVLNAYREAIVNRMRFYSYGDAMLIL